MIDHADVISYFEQLAVKHKEILHEPDTNIAFCHGDVDTLDYDVAGCNSSGYIMLMEAGSGSLVGQNEISAVDRPDFAIIICKAVPERDLQEQIRVETDSKRIAFEVLGRVKKHRDLGNTIVQDFDLLSVRYNRISGFGNNHFGFRVQFNLTAPSGIKDVPENWNE